MSNLRDLSYARGMPVGGIPAGGTSATSRWIVTPEAVLLDFEVAGLASRLLSRLIDSVVLLGAFWAFSIGLNVVQFGLGPVATVVVATVGIVAIFFGYPIFTETRMQGRTVGRRALGLRAVTNEGGPIRPDMRLSIACSRSSI